MKVLDRLRIHESLQEDRDESSEKGDRSRSVLVRELIMEMKKRALEWKKKAEKATVVQSGSPYVNLVSLVSKVLLLP